MKKGKKRGLAQPPFVEDEQQFLAGYDASQFPHPSVAIDVALITVANGKLKAALIERDSHPAKGKWCLPGSFVQIDESLDDAAARVLAQKAGVKHIFLEQLYTFGRPDRDPRTRVISVAYYALVNSDRLIDSQLKLMTLWVPWPGEKGGPVQALDEQDRELMLAFDHAAMLGMLVKRLRGKLDYAPIGFELLPKKFTFRQLQTIHETILNRTVNKDSFRRRMLESGLISATGKFESDVGHRPAELYRFRRKNSSTKKNRKS